MRKILGIALWVLGATITGGAGLPPATAGEATAPVPVADGFRELRWGMTEEQARTKYPDLAFARYALPEGEATPSRVLVRGNEAREIDGAAFDTVEYWFRDGGFRKVVAEMHAPVGPRTLESLAEGNFEIAASALWKKFGNPVEDRFTGTVRIGRRVAWERGGTAAVLAYGTDAGDRSFLRLEIERKAP